MRNPRLKPYIQFIRTQEGANIYGRENEIWEAAGGSVPDLLRLAPYLDGTRTVEEAAREAGIDSHLAAQIVEYLQRLGLVTEEPPPSREVAAALADPELRSQVVYMDQYGFQSGLEGASRLLQARVVAVGSGPRFQEAVQTLRRVGIGRVEAAAEVAETLSEQWDLAVVLDTGEGPARFREANAEYGARRIPWLRGVLNGAELMVGPLFIPGETACYQCYEYRLFANISHPEYNIPRYRHQLTDGRGLPANSCVAAGPIFAGMIALAAFKFLARVEPCEFVGHEYSLNLHTLDSALRPLLVVPICPVCRPERRPMQALVRTGTQGGENGGETGPVPE